MRPLKIPLFLQPFNEPYCGPTCIKMVMSFYGKRTSLKRLVDQLPMIKTGIDMCSMGIFLMNIGFGVKIFIDPDAADFKHSIYKRRIPMFIKQGGLLIPRAIKISDIRKALAQNYPIILNVANNDGRGHFVVVRNIGQSKITLNDPSLGTKVLSIERVMKACHNWSGGAIIISK